MFRFRRYRNFIAFAVITIFIFYQFTSLRFGRVPSVADYKSPGKGSIQHVEKPHAVSPVFLEKPPALNNDKGPHWVFDADFDDIIEEARPVDEGPPPPTWTFTAVSKAQPEPEPEEKEKQYDKPDASPIKGKAPTKDKADGDKDGLPVLHWTQNEEHFPVPPWSVIQLPTGKPKNIPKIQHPFDEVESPAEKDKRLTRLGAIIEAFNHSWSGYKQHAWLHDELVPIKAEAKDPFCGWAATLIDTLDTLWIMGLKEEFEEAAWAVNKIDFTTTHRNDIPLFETTIRYLGGLLSAYDISGQKYKNLLTKATELAEVLMGAFDTPNRMPLMYYRWKPAFASQPHRAGTRINLAELGSLSMEFTRLAQLTSDSKYYDAIARISNALHEWQTRTAVPGLWPITVDASGCEKKTKTYTGDQFASLPYNVSLLPTLPEKTSKYSRPESPSSAASLPPSAMGAGAGKKAGTSVTTDDANFASSKKASVLDNEKAEIRGAGEHKGLGREPPPKAMQKRQLEVPVPNSEAGNLTDPVISAVTGKEIGNEYDCSPQGLASPWKSAAEQFGLGTRSDSTYEYLPKQHLLLGGLEEQYKEMYVKAINAIKEKLLFKPHTHDHWDVLIAGTLNSYTSGQKLAPELQHLSCFAGGMIAMGAKIFDRSEELEIGKKLTDGCVWAYESTTTGVMPEVAQIMPCPDPECRWNETAWHDALDPNWQLREKQHQKILAGAQASLEEEDTKKPEFEPTTDDPAIPPPVENPITGLGSPPLGKRQLSADAAPVKGLNPSVGGSPKNDKATPDEAPADKTPLEKASAGTSAIEKAPAGKASTEKIPAGTVSTEKTSADKVSTEKAAAGKASTEKAPAGKVPTEEVNADKSPPTKSTPKTGTVPEKDPESEAVLKDPPVVPSPSIPEESQSPPLSHPEFVADRIESERLPPSFLRISDTRYKLRPEAIESVFIMYRITGDEYWREKGWKMFMAIQSYTRTQWGNTAIDDVTSTAPLPLDFMESFWLAETLKYFYLLFSEPDLVSLDEWVFNTEAHPFRRPDAPAFEA